MKRFITKTFWFVFFMILFILFVYSRAGSRTDSFYVRFTTPKQKNLILGTSKAAQGLQPQEFKQILNQDFFNYSFSIHHSPYGPVYLKSIQRKHNKEKGANFILEVSPWSISSFTDTPNDTNSFRERKYFLNDQIIVNQNPNISYLRNHLSQNKFKLLFPSKHHFLHKDGWLEILEIPMDPASVEKRTNQKVRNYQIDIVPIAQYSQVRRDYLLKTIDYLQNYGKVFLVRLPIDKRILDLETKFMPDFDSVITPAIEQSHGYLDFTKEPENYQTTDGNHLYKDAGKEVSQIIANWMNQQ